MSKDDLRDEYEEIYEERPKFGYLFYSKNGSLSKPYDLDEFDILEMEEGKGNSQNIFIRCDPCGTCMDFIESEVIMKGIWKCPICGRKVREATPYNKLEQMNEKFIRETNEDDYDEIY